jgi:hypothetical protein
VQNLSWFGQDAGSPQVGLDGDGDAVFTWTRFDGAHDRAQARTRSPAGVLGTIQLLSNAGRSAREPQVAVEPDGDAVFVWTRSDGSDDRVQTRTRSAAGTLGAVQTVSAAGEPAGEPQVAVSSGGDVTVVWTRSDGAHRRVQARSRSAGGAVGPLLTLSEPAQSASAPQLALSPTAGEVFAWERSDGLDPRIEAAVR